MVNVDFLFTCSDQKCKKLLRIRNKEHFALVYCKDTVYNLHLVLRVSINLACFFGSRLCA